MINNVQTIGFDTVMIGMFGASFAQVGAVIAIYLRTKNIRMKSLCVPAIVSGFAGVTEPAIYGITLPKKKPFAITCVIGAITGGILAATGAKYYVVPGMGVFGYPAFMNTVTKEYQGVIWAVLVSVAALIAGSILVYLTYKDEDGAVQRRKRQAEVMTKKISSEGEVPTNAEENERTISICAPLTGNVIPLSEVKDEAFSSGALGQGAAIVPEEGKLYAPVDGVIAAFFPTGHAVGMVTDDGMELLIHVGMDTVSLNGNGFVKKVSQGDRVKKGDLLLEFDLHTIEEAGLSAVTPVLVTNPAGRQEVKVTETEHVKPGDDFLTVQ